MTSRIEVAAVLAVALCLGSVSASTQPVPSKRMPDGRQWMTRNLDVAADGSSCYDDSEANCRRYGRLYTWAAAGTACRSLGDGWRLPGNDEWRQLAKQYGGLLEESPDASKATFTALIVGGSSGFDAVLGGGRVEREGTYARLDAHGFYWTATETDAEHAWLYNFGKGLGALNRHSTGEKKNAFAVRCIRD